MNKAKLLDKTSLLQSIVQDGFLLLAKFPKLRPSPSSLLPIRNLIVETEAKKSNITEELTIIRNSLNKLAQRIRLPVLVGVVGRFSSGKSTLLNAFFYKLFSERIPDEIFRETAKTSTDQLFSYITHADFSDSFVASEDLKIIHTDHEVFRTINFIDTPGNGWTDFNKTEISDLLSASDVILFVFHPNNILDADAVKALYEKFTRFDNVPIWYVITNAKEYMNELDDSISYHSFQKDLIDAKDKLGKRDVFSDVDRMKRDLVHSRVTFIPHENTYLVDGKNLYGIDELLTRILDHFGSATAIQQKAEEIQKDLHDDFLQLKKLLAIWESGLVEIAEVLQNTVSTKISQSIYDLKNVIISGKVSYLGEKLFATQRQYAKNSEIIPQRMLREISIAYLEQPPELTILRHQIRELRNESKERDFIYDQQDVLIDRRMVSVYLTDFEKKVVNSLRQVLDGEWIFAKKKVNQSRGSRWERIVIAVEKMLRGYPNEGLFPRIKVRSLISIIRDEKSSVIKHVKNGVGDRAQDLISYMNEKIGIVNKSFDERANSTTIFSRQRRLLDQMKLDIPEHVQNSIKSVNEFSSKMNQKNEQIMRLLELEINKNAASLEEHTQSFLEKSVFIPLNEAMTFLFYKGTGSKQEQVETPDTNLLSKFEFSEKLNDYRREFQDRLKQTQSECIAGLEESQVSWQTQYGELSSNFQSLTQNAINVVDALALIRVASSEETDRLIKISLTSLDRSLERLASTISSDISQQQDIIADALQGAADQREKEKIVTNLIMILSILAPLIEFVRSNFFLNSNIFFVLVSLSIFFGGLVLVYNRQAEDAKVRAELADRIYEGKSTSLLHKVEKTISEETVSVTDELDAWNTELRRILRSKYEQVLTTIEDIDEGILDKLDRQIGLGAKLAVDTINELTTAENTAIQKVSELSEDILFKICEKAPQDLENHLQGYVDNVSRENLSMLNGQLRVYWDQAHEIADISSRLNNEFLD